MDTTHPNWKSLPVELLEIILQLAAQKQSKSEACNVARVCKAWKRTAQSVAYSNITINSLSQFKKFHDVIVHSPQLGFRVKALNFDHYKTRISKTDNIEESKLLTGLLTTSLPNLEVLKKVDLHSCVPTLSTLLNSRLKKLKRLSNYSFLDENEVAKYVNCAVILKGRLEEVYISLDFEFPVEERNETINLEYQRLYDHLYQFNNLVNINVTRESNDGKQVLEYIVEACPSLKSITLYLTFPDDQLNLTSPDFDASVNKVSKYVPRPYIKSLEVFPHWSRFDYDLPLYIMHKFTNLQKLSLELPENNPQYNTHLFTPLWNYFSTIDEYSIFGFYTNQNNILEIIGHIYEKTSKPGSENVCINISFVQPLYIKTTIDIAKQVNEGGMKITLKYPAHADFDWAPYMKFIQTSGKYIGVLCIDIAVKRYELPVFFFHQTLAYCSNLKHLSLIGYALKQVIYPQADFDSKFSIDELSLRVCQIQDGMLEQLSSLLFKIKRLCLYLEMKYICGIDFLDEGKTDISPPMVTLPHTDINCITFAVDPSIQHIYAKILVLADEQCYYYRIFGREQDGYIETSTKQEYSALNNYQHVYISCTTKPEIQMEIAEHV